MRISKIGVTPNQSFSGEKSEKAKKTLKNTAGAAAVALATAMPMQKADAQIYYPQYPIIPPTSYYYNVQPSISVPDCFVYGDINNFDYNKTLGETFADIDSKVNENGVITAAEVVAAERDNWNATHLYPYNTFQRNQTLRNFNILSEMFNHDESNPRSINYNEYKDIMKTYMQERNVTNFFNLLRILTIPRIVCPPAYPHHHHHHHHRH